MEAECVVCLQSYDEGEHTPRVLSCGHSICQSCVADLRSHWGGGGSGGGKVGQLGGGLVRCPECKQHTKVPIGGLLELPKNIELMRLIQGATKPRNAGNSGELYARVVKKEESGSSIEQDSTIPCPLFSCVYAEPVVWILPQAAVKRRREMVCGFCIGDFFYDKNLQSKVQEVSLHFLSKIDPNEEDSSERFRYTELVRLAWDNLHHEVRAKLMRLLDLGYRCNYFTEVAGLWMSEEGMLFLVSKVCVEGIKQAMSLLCPMSDNIISAEGESSLCDSSKENDIGKISLRTLIRLGVELCEILLEIHAARLVVGILGSNSFVLDAYGHLRLCIGNCIYWRGCIGVNFLCSKLKPCISSLGVGILIIEEVDKTNSSNTEYPSSSYEYLSPEVLEIIKKFVDTEKAAGLPSEVVSSSCSNGDEAKHVIVTQKADVWSVGRLLLQLLSGSSLLGGLEYSEVHAGVNVNSTQEDVLEQNVCFKEQLLKCTAGVPSNRPRVVDMWWELKGLLDDQALGIPSHLLEDFKRDKLDLEICDSGSTMGNPPADNCTIEPETATEGRAKASQDPQTSMVEATADAPSLSRALIDVGESIVKTLQGHLDTVSCLSVCGRYLISASYDKTLCVWSLDDYRMVQVFKGHEQRITALAVYEASELCVSGDYGGHIYAWNITSGGISAPVATWLEHQDWRFSGIASLAISSDEFLYSGSGDRTIKAWSTVGFEHVATMEGHKGVVSVLMVEGQILYSGSWDGTIRLWWRPDHSPLANFGGASSVPLGGIRALVKCPANGLLFSGHDSGVIQIWNEEDCVGTLKAHKGIVSALAFDQGWLYSSSWDGFVKAWPLEDVLSGVSVPVERKFSQAAVTALCCRGEDKLFVGILQKIQACSHEVVI